MAPSSPRHSRRASAAQRRRTLRARTPSASSTIAAVALLLALLAGTCIPSATLTWTNVAVPLLVTLATFGAVLTHAGKALPRIGTHAVDAIVIVATVLLVAYVGPPTPVLAENHNYFLGPALDVLHGRPMLVSTFSQYGVGMFYALAAYFLAVPIGYGTFTLLLSSMTAALLVVIYLVLRWSSQSLLVAATGLVSIVALCIFGQIDFYSYFPSTGVLRFGLPWLIILALSHRPGRRATSPCSTHRYSRSWRSPRCGVASVGCTVWAPRQHSRAGAPQRRTEVRHNVYAQPLPRARCWWLCMRAA